MRALYKFPSLAAPVLGDDEICPLLRINNTYDGTSRVALEIGAFRFCCTNLSIGGGGAFAGGFVAVHAGEIPIETVADKLADYLTCFGQIAQLYRQWTEQRPQLDILESVLLDTTQGRFADLRQDILANSADTVFGAYNRLTYHATHKMRTARTAFAFLERINVAFQNAFPIDRKVIDVRPEPILADA